MESRLVALGQIIFKAILAVAVLIFSFVFGFEWLFSQAINVMEEMDREAKEKKHKPKTQLFLYESEQLPTI